MSELKVVGGIYRERCVQPNWNAVYGSGGRGAAAAASLANTTLISYEPRHFVEDAKQVAKLHGFQIDFRQESGPISFYYMHPLANPIIEPSPAQIRQHPALRVSGEVVLRYGMLEGSAVVDADVAIYDPQSVFGAEAFHTNGSQAKRLAIILNLYEAQSIVGAMDPVLVAQNLMRMESAEVVIVKLGSRGALVTWNGGSEVIPAYQTERVWKIGSGDVYSAIFAALWGVHRLTPVKAARYASKATADYCNDRTLPAREVGNLDQLNFQPVIPGKGQIYLAGPFFDLGQRWLIEETRAALRSMGAQVFSPIHEIGPGPAMDVGPADIKGLDESDVVFAIINGLDPGTIFEVGYAVKKGIPVIAFAENIKDEDLKMIIGSGCEVTDDFTSAVYRTVWKLRA